MALAFRIFGVGALFVLYGHKHLIRNNGLMSVNVEIAIHEIIVFNLRNAGADCLLK